MNDAVITDLKQFFATTVSERVAALRVDLKRDIVDDLKQYLDTTVVDDLKQYLSATVSQEGAEIRNDFHVALQVVTAELKQDITNLSNSVADTFDLINSENDKRFKYHERRMTKLERRNV